MCSTGGGNSLLESMADVALQTATAGFAGYKGDEGVGLGVKGKLAKKGVGAIGEGLKEVTGAAAAEEANKLARQQMEENKAQMLQERENLKAQNAARQIAASRQAASVRSTSTGPRGATTRTSLKSNLGGDERDFLGL